MKNNQMNENVNYKENFLYFIFYTYYFFPKIFRSDTFITIERRIQETTNQFHVA